VALTGKPTLQIILDRESVDFAFNSLKNAATTESRQLAEELGKDAVEFLYGLETGIGHVFLAPMWKATDPETSPDGSVAVEVYSEAENMTFQTKSRAPFSTKTYPIEGKALLSILLNGARPHPIAASEAAFLQFPASIGERRSKFAGIAFVEAGVGAARFLNPSFNDFVEVPYVNHPGVIGNRFLDATKVELERKAAAAGEAVASRINARVV